MAALRLQYEIQTQTNITEQKRHWLEQDGYRSDNFIIMNRKQFLQQLLKIDEFSDYIDPKKDLPIIQNHTPKFPPRQQPTHHRHHRKQGFPKDKNIKVYFQKAAKKANMQSYLRVRTTPHEIILECVPESQQGQDFASVISPPRNRIETEPNHYLMIKEMQPKRFADLTEQPRKETKFMIKEVSDMTRRYSLNVSQGKVQKSFRQPRERTNSKSSLAVSRSMVRNPQYPSRNKVELLGKSSIEKQRKINAKIQQRKELIKQYKRPFVPPPKITAASYLVWEVIPGQQGKLWASLNCKSSQQIASLTKIMTGITVIQLLQQWKLDPRGVEAVIGKMESSIGGTSAKLEQGQIYTIYQLLFGLMLPSGNDASLALAIWAGSQLLARNKAMVTLDSDKIEEPTKNECYLRFIREMNDKASSIGMIRTTYANSHGLSNFTNRSTAYDQAMLCQYAMKNSLFREVVSTPFYEGVIRWKPRKVGQRCMAQPATPIRWQNTHKLLHKRPEEYIGVKTGNTPTAGPCLASYLTIKDRKFIIIVLTSAKPHLRFKETEALKKWLCKQEGLPLKASKQEEILEPSDDSSDEKSRED